MILNSIFFLNYFFRVIENPTNIKAINTTAILILYLSFFFLSTILVYIYKYILCKLVKHKKYTFILMYSFYQNLGKYLSVDIGKDAGKIIFYYTSHPTAKIFKKLSLIKMFINKDGKWEEKNLDIIRVKPFKDKNGKRFFQVQSTERTFFVPKKAIEENGSMMNIF
ncbi:uncharacterized protein METZ01_LOCUS93842 [marine metagenome]|uniref:Uncharacterized protein n=1 Tax=marine metagenome TaxID=408172 RepID=A0A381VMJ6_9ZZZZ